VNEIIAYAIRVAYSMSKDPEVESIANAIVVRALRTYDFSIPLKRWVARLVKMAIWDYWRELKRRREVSMSEEWWEEVYDKQTEAVELPVEGEELQMLCEKHLEKWCLDVIARRHNTTVYQVKRTIREAEAKLEVML
jgi:DNA-directed RNA polymerase specialized sigma24 family protein